MNNRIYFAFICRLIVFRFSAGSISESEKSASVVAVIIIHRLRLIFSFLLSLWAPFSFSFSFSHSLSFSFLLFSFSFSLYLSVLPSSHRCVCCTFTFFILNFASILYFVQLLFKSVNTTSTHQIHQLILIENNSDKHYMLLVFFALGAPFYKRMLIIVPMIPKHMNTVTANCKIRNTNAATADKVRQRERKKRFTAHSNINGKKRKNMVSIKSFDPRIFTRFWVVWKHYRKN